MAWTTPHTYVDATVPNAALFNVDIRDNQTYLKAVLDGTASQNVTLLGLLTVGNAATIVSTSTNDPTLVFNRAGAAAWYAGIDTSASDTFIIGQGAVVGTTPQLMFSPGGALRALDCSAAGPAWSFISDTDTGIYRSGSNLIDFAVGGAQVAQISSVGVLAAGTTVSTGGFSFINDPDTGMFRGAANAISFLIGGANLFIMEQSSTRYGQTSEWLFVDGSLAVVQGSAVPLVVDRQTNDGTLISLRQDSTEEGSISVSTTTVAYNTFMGAHMTQLKANQEEPPAGGVVVTTGEIVQSDNVHYIEDVVEVAPETKEAKAERAARETTVRQVRHDKRQGPGSSAWREVKGETKDYLPHISGTTTEGDPAVYGVWIGMLREDAAGSSFGRNGRPVYNVAGLGAYEVRVTDTGGDIVAGDLLCASGRKYEAMKQADDVIRAGTLGKALSRVSWKDVEVDRALGYKWQLVSVALYCG